MKKTGDKSNSFEDRFYLENPTWLARLKRNGRLLLTLLMAAIAWLVKGHRLRGAIRRAKQNGSPLQLEDWVD